MKIYKRAQAFLVSARIEYHWWWILRLRKRGEAWLSRGEELNSPRLLRLNERLDRHGLIAKKCEKYYEEHYIPPLRAEKTLAR